MNEATSPDGAGAVLDEPGSKACLLIAASYADVADAVEPVVASAAGRILVAPTLGDFVELRSADCGPRPSPDEPDDYSSGHAAAAARIAEALTRPTAGADENYFALVVVDQSAATAARLLNECRSNPAIAGLRPRCRGFAATEDRPAPPADDQTANSNVVVAPAGMWTERTLAAGLQHYAEELFRHFATTYQPGVTSAELAEIRDRAGLTEPNLVVPRSADQDPALDLQPASPTPDQVSSPNPPREAALALPSPDELSPPSPPPDSGLARNPADPLASADPVATAGPAASADPVVAPGAPALSAAPAAETAPEAADTEAPAAHRARLWRLASRRLRGSGPPGEQADGQAQPETEEIAITTVAPVFLLLYGVTSPDEQVSWREARSLSVSLDRKITSSRPVAFKLRAFSSAVGGAKNALQDAGSLCERDIKRPDPQLDFEQSLNSLRKAVASDLGALGRATLPAVRPAVVIFAVDVPVADVISAQAYKRLAEQASVIWVVPERSANLISPVFTAGVPVLTFHDGTDDEIVGLLYACASPPPPSDGAEPAAETESYGRHASTR
jgi:hypothetical protein